MIVWYDGGMTSPTFDTLKLSEELLAAGFEEKAARVLAEKFGELANEHLVTKEYLDFKIGELRNELKNLELRLTIKLAIIVFAVLTFFELVNRFLGS